MRSPTCLGLLAIAALAFAGPISIGPSLIGQALIGPAAAQDGPSVTIRNHRFEPERIEVPAGVKFKLMVTNADATAEEFESTELHREKVVPAGQQIPVLLGPLAKGEYKVFGDYHPDTAQGVLVAR